MYKMVLQRLSPQQLGLPLQWSRLPDDQAETEKPDLGDHGAVLGAAKSAILSGTAQTRERRTSRHLHLPNRLRKTALGGCDWCRQLP